MPTNTTMDQYFLEVEVPLDGTSDLARMIATNKQDGDKTAETQMSRNGLRQLLSFAYGGEANIVNNLMDYIETHGSYTLTVSEGSTDMCIFTPDELVRFGFKPGDFE